MTAVSLAAHVTESAADALGWCLTRSIALLGWARSKLDCTGRFSFLLPRAPNG
jgi:hypothetical protein